MLSAKKPKTKMAQAAHDPWFQDRKAGRWVDEETLSADPAGTKPFSHRDLCCSN
jgi:hypothetical protein